MIEVYVSQRGEKSRLFVTGHASEGPLREVVCAAVSALSCALVLYADRDKECRRLRYHMASGEVFLSCHGLGKGFEVVREGLAALALRYPEYVRLAVDDTMDLTCYNEHDKGQGRNRQRKIKGFDPSLV